MEQEDKNAMPPDLKLNDISHDPQHKPVNTSIKNLPNKIVDTEKACEHSDSWTPIAKYAPEFLDTELDVPGNMVDENFFKFFVSSMEQNAMVQDVMLANHITASGKPNRFGCRIPVASAWKLDILEEWLKDYHDYEITEWLKYGFPISRIDYPMLVPANTNHLRATLFPEAIDAYVEKELRLGATIGPFTVPPFLGRIGVSPLSTRPKRNSTERQVIMDLCFPFDHLVNDAINKDEYCGLPIKLTYPTIDTLAQRVAEIGLSCKLWKKDLIRGFRQIPLCPRNYSWIRYRWCNYLFFDKVMPMGLRLAAYICQRITNAIVFLHRNLGFWSINYLDDFGSAELEKDAWHSFNAMGNIMKDIGVQEAPEKSVPPTTRMEFLGNTVDTVKMTLEVSQDRVQELLTLLICWESKPKYTKKQLQLLIGKLSFVTNCVWAGRIFISQLIAKVAEFGKQSELTANDELRKDIRWWRFFYPFDGVSILWLQDVAEPDKLLASDASLIGGGAVCGKQMCHFKFPANILWETDHISQRELYTIVIAVKISKQELQGKMIRFSTDNEASMFAINKGCTSDKFMLKCLRELAWVCAKNQILMKAVYIPTKQNILPDALSRWYINADAHRTVCRVTDNTWTRCSVCPKLLTFSSTW